MITSGQMHTNHANNYSSSSFDCSSSVARDQQFDGEFEFLV